MIWFYVSKPKEKIEDHQKSHSRHPEPTSCLAYEGSKNGMLLFLFPSPFLDSSRVRQAGRVRMTRKASRVRMTKWYNIWLHKTGFDRRHGKNLPALQYFLWKPVKSRAFSYFFFCENTAISRLSCYCSSLSPKTHTHAAQVCDNFVFLYF